MEKTLKEQGTRLFEKRSGLLNLWQCLAENFYVERADFTTVRNEGDEYATNLTTSYPLLARRTLGDTLGSMLRPSAKEWFHTRTNRPDAENTQARQWLDWATRLQKRAMYERTAQFARATKQGDHDFATFGQTAMSIDLNRSQDSLLYRTWHLRDCAWAEGDDGSIAAFYRKWKPTNRDLKRLFPRGIHKKVDDQSKKKPFDEVECWHIVLAADIYENTNPTKRMRTPFVSIHFDVANNHIMEISGQFDLGYIVPRWAMVSGSQYAHSPATVVALPDARLLQRVSAVLLDAGEKAVTPPMIAAQEAIRGDINVYAGGVTWADQEYDERLGEVLRPMTVDRSGIAFGIEIQADIRQMISEGFFLNKLNLPPAGNGDMTAYEVGQRVQEYIRSTMPIFEPMEQEYNGQLCEMTFNRLMRAGAFGRRDAMPESLWNADITFQFESPLRDAEDRATATQLMELKQVFATAMDADPTVVFMLNTHKAVRDVALAVAPAEWLEDEATVKQKVDAQKQQQEAQQSLAVMQQGADVAKTLQEAKGSAGESSPVAIPSVLM